MAVVDSGPAMEAAVEVHRPELIVCPFLKTIIPESVCSKHRCLVVHPGPVGDRGPSSLDWAIELGMGEWGVTVLEATGEVDGGDIWAHAQVPDAPGRQEQPVPPRGAPRRRRGARRGRRRSSTASFSPDAARLRRPARDRAAASAADARPSARSTGPSDASARILRKIRAAEGNPGVLDRIGGVEFHLFGAHAERALRGTPGAIIAQRDGAICRATVDGAVWITHLKRRDEATQKFFKLPATRALAAGRPGGGRAGGAGAAPRAGRRRRDPSRDLLRGARRRRLPPLRLLQRRDEHGAVPAPARGIRATRAPAARRGRSC